jgi:hypothetical protein
VLLGWCALLPWLAVLDRSPTLASALGSGLLTCEAFVVAVFFWFAQAIATYTGAPLALGVLVLMLLAPLLQPPFLVRRGAPSGAPPRCRGLGDCAHRRVRVCRCGVGLFEAVRRHPRARPAMSRSR